MDFAGFFWAFAWSCFAATPYTSSRDSDGRKASISSDRPGAGARRRSSPRLGGSSGALLAASGGGA